MHQKVLLLHGPVISNGINFLTAELHPDPNDRKNNAAPFHGGENIRALSHAFRARGYRIAYSGWTNDTDWLKANATLFDCYCIHPQDNIPNSVNFFGEVVQNNKEKLYRSIYYGLNTIRDTLGEDCAVMRLRSDVAVDAEEVDKCIAVLRNTPRAFFVEYIKSDHILSIPDFLSLADWQEHFTFYQHLVHLCDTDSSYHISSHVDHGIELLYQLEQGNISKLICMTREMHDSMVWRGIPRFFAKNLKGPNDKLAFNCEISFPPSFTVASALEGLHPNFSGKTNKLQTADATQVAQ